MPKRNSKDKVLNIKTTTTKSGNGMNLKEEKTERILIAQEPTYIKLYLNTLLAFKELPKQMSPLLLELLKLMSFADPDSDHGGQLIVLSSIVKESILKRLDIKLNTLNHGLVKLSKCGILKRLGLNTYQANPNMFGRGEWSDIKLLQATFDFINGTVKADIESDIDNLSFLERAAAGKISTDDDDIDDDDES
jgi:hypothetical protein